MAVCGLHRLFLKLYLILLRIARLFKLVSVDKPTLDDIEIVYHSAHYLVVNKRNDVLINSNNKGDLTVQTQLSFRLPHLVNPNLGHEFWFSHRLDYATSGLLCLALHKSAASAISKCFVDRHVEKYYLAIVRGHVAHQLIDITLGIGKDIRRRWYGIRMASESSPHVGHCRAAHTRVLVLQYGLYENYPATKVMLKPITGRRHQLRVHLNHLGHTIVGDYTYSNQSDVSPHRMFLHAFRLAVPSPFDAFDVSTPDPFSERDPRNRWLAVKTLNKLNSSTFHKIKHGKKYFEVVR